MKSFSLSICSLFFLFTSLTLFSNNTFSAVNQSMNQAPPAFSYKNAKAVYIDITSANYKITYDLSSEKVSVESVLKFTMNEAGFPIFDLIPTPQSEIIDGATFKSELIKDPDSISKLRVVTKLLQKGNHELVIKHMIDEGTSFKSEGVASAFWMSDLSDREYLEQYLPINLEFDQVPMHMHVEILNANGKPHKLRANGKVKINSENNFDVDFPKFYTTSSLFFHLLPEKSVESSEFIFSSVNGRKLPVEVYTSRGLQSFVDEVKKVLAELEADYGPFPHEKVIVYGAGMGGMEYSGATMTELRAVGHELFHSYNARGVMPANGNSGWMDEALSSWRDIKYAVRSTPGGKTTMAGHSVYTRETDQDAYTRGRDFVAWIANRFKNDGKDFKTFLKSYFTKNFYTTVTTNTFQTDIENYSGYNLTSEFNEYIYGNARAGRGLIEENDLSVNGKREKLIRFEKARKQRKKVKNIFHPELTKQQLRQLLWP